MRFLSGAIEGFYGQPWGPADRLQLFDWLAEWGLNTYLYAPKDDLHHRAVWREPYAAEEMSGLQHLVEACAARAVSFAYAISPGLDIDYSRDGELNHVFGRFEQLLSIGCSDFALLFDDIPASPDPRWPSLATAQCRVANAVFTWLRARRPDGRFLFCPTAYCGRMATAGLGGQGYLATVGRDLLPGIDVLWTGPDIVSAAISVPHVRDVATVLQRRPVIWDNLHANDYDSRRFFCGPYAGRPIDLRGEVAGLLSNPNNELLLNYVPLRTLARFVHCGGAWDPRQEYLAAMAEWHSAFASVRTPLTREDLILFGDCYYLPHEYGPEAEALYRAARGMLAGEAPEHARTFHALATRLRGACDAIAELRHRPLFHALSRRIWELRDALDRTERFAAGPSSASSGAESHRGGLVDRLERLRSSR